MAGEEVDTRRESGLVPYRRGVSFREVAKGTLTRFLPGSLLTMIGGTSIFGIVVSSDLLMAVGGFMGIAGALTVGFGVGLLGLRRWLYPDARVGGSRSFIAGLVSPLALFIAAAFSQGWTMAQLPPVLVVVGVVLAVLMFFAWLSPTPEHMRGAGFEAESDNEALLTGGAS